MLSAFMYGLNVWFNDVVNPIAVGALVLSCLSWLMLGLADSRSDKFDMGILLAYIVGLGVLGIWALLHITKPDSIILPPVRVLTFLLCVLSSLNCYRQFRKVDMRALIVSGSSYNNATNTRSGSTREK
jgi:hypothetical protein